MKRVFLFSLLASNILAADWKPITPEELQLKTPKIAGLGKMMMFDPTDTDVPLGFIPDHEQDSWALLLAGDKGDIFRTPATMPSTNHLERTAIVKLTPEGGVSATIQQKATGQEAFDNRMLMRRMAANEYVKMVERCISRTVPGAAFGKIEPKDNIAQQQFDLHIDFSSPAYAKSMQGRLLMVKPIMLNYGGIPDVSNPKRTQPLIIDPVSFRERVEMEIPPGFAIDEMPDSGAIESEFGKYKASFQANGNKVIVERELELKATWVPVEGFKAVRDFVGKIGGTEQAPVVLIRK
jgi:hypothetical protein